MVQSFLQQGSQLPSLALGKDSSTTGESNASEKGLERKKKTKSSSVLNWRVLARGGWSRDVSCDWFAKDMWLSLMGLQLVVGAKIREDAFLDHVLTILGPLLQRLWVRVLLS